MNKTQVMQQLKSFGTAQNRKVYARHGFTGTVYGVSYANLGKLKKQIKVDQKLAEQLWSTGVHDAQVLATMIADPEQVSAKTLDSWAKSSGNRGTAGAVSDIAAKSSTAWQRMEKWIKSRSEWVSVAGWHTLASLARDDEDVSNAKLERYLERIETEIDGAKNYTRYAMNNALISIGIRNAKLKQKAIAAAKRIGKVDVDHGETSCKTPDAVPYIEKGYAHRAKKASKKAAAKKGRKKATSGAR